VSPLIALASVAQSIVLIASPVQSVAKAGTGFVIASSAGSAEILTAAHVVEGIASPWVYIGGPHGDRVSAVVVRTDALRDIALLEIQTGKLPTLQLADSAVPTSGTDVQVYGYPTKTIPGRKKSSPPQNAPLSDLTLVTAMGKADGEAEEGGAILLALSVTHGDSGAPVLDVKTGRVVAMTLAMANGYGSQSWITGDGLGASVASIDAFLHPLLPSPVPPKPAYVVAMSSGPTSDITSSWRELADSAGFVPADTGKPTLCNDANGKPLGNAAIEETGSAPDLSMDVNDCSGAPFFHYELASGETDMAAALRVIHRTFLGFIDSHRPQWQSLLRYGVAADPVKNPFLALMSVERNPFRQLTVAHVFRRGPADLAGVQPGDAIVKIDGRPTNTLGDQFVARLLNQPRVTLLLDRQEHEVTARIHLRRFDDLIAAGPVPR
jgi:S1-C subfamily serine protease